MTYLSLDKIREARAYVEQNIKKPDTFMGLVLFLICVVERMRKEVKNYVEIFLP